eukprot:TRINITY_DN11353_c0_g2_i1.p2 TRINITY_DN11353_c0_g2~~TRINITY_DN11353_c0_g2_i1.p2  ORF type:complete len:102 (-),score=10.21 TRINITY_DN11353_c0_g2_i1:1340-1645(-)
MTLCLGRTHCSQVEFYTQNSLFGCWHSTHFTHSLDMLSMLQSVHCPYLELHATEFLLHREFDATMPTVAPLFDVGICVGYMICSLPHGSYACEISVFRYPC